MTANVCRRNFNFLSKDDGIQSTHLIFLQVVLGSAFANQYHTCAKELIEEFKRRSAVQFKGGSKYTIYEKTFADFVKALINRQIVEKVTGEFFQDASVVVSGDPDKPFDYWLNLDAIKICAADNAQLIGEKFATAMEYILKN